MIMSNDPHQKVQAEHLKRDAYLYIRQSTIQQVFHNTESTQRQYALKQRAVALGWPAERFTRRMSSDWSNSRNFTVSVRSCSSGLAGLTPKP